MTTSSSAPGRFARGLPGAPLAKRKHKREARGAKESSCLYQKGPLGERTRKAALSAGLPDSREDITRGGEAGQARKAPSGVPPP